MPTDDWKAGDPNDPLLEEWAPKKAPPLTKAPGGRPSVTVTPRPGATFKEGGPDDPLLQEWAPKSGTPEASRASTEPSFAARDVPVSTRVAQGFEEMAKPIPFAGPAAQEQQRLVPGSHPSEADPAQQKFNKAMDFIVKDPTHPYSTDVATGLLSIAGGSGFKKSGLARVLAPYVTTLIAAAAKGGAFEKGAELLGGGSSKFLKHMMKHFEE